MNGDDGQYGGHYVPLSFDPKFMGGAAEVSLSHPDAYKFLWVGRILHVDTETMVCSIKLETGVGGERFDVPIPASGGAGPRSWAGTMPEPNTKVLIGWKRYSNRAFTPYIVEFLTVGVLSAREYEPFSTVDPKDAQEALRQKPSLAYDPRVTLGVVRLKMRKVYSGDFLASSSSGADLVLDNDVTVMNRAGNEFRLRDADQTAVLQTINAYESNATGFYRRGLIKRSALNFLPDLAASGFDSLTGSQEEFLEGKFNISVEDYENFRYVVNQIPVDSPAYDKLLEFGLIDDEGVPVFPSDPDKLNYPFVVTNDGQRISFTTVGEPEKGFDQTDYAYVEDRKELRHMSDGVMAVTEEGDGFQIDINSPPFIEDVYGTVVGNDAYSDAGRPFYNKILTMKLFNDPSDGVIAPAPMFESVDTLTSQTEANTKALCRLFRIQSQTSNSQYAFGITKEGRVFLHVPKSLTGLPQDKGKSIDASIAGLVKAVLGKDDNTGTSLDFRTKGGINLDIGAFQGPDPEESEQISVNLNLAGKIRTTYSGAANRETFITGSDTCTVTGSAARIIDGSCIDAVGGVRAVEAVSISHNAGPGGYKGKVAGEYNLSVFGKAKKLHAQEVSSTFALGNEKITVAGIDSTEVFVGGIKRTVRAGNIEHSVNAGNKITTVNLGNHIVSVDTGNYLASVGTGNLTLACTGGNVSISSGALMSLSASAYMSLTAPGVKIGSTVVGTAVVGTVGPPSPHQDFIVGRPLFGVPNIQMG
jgi:hypothetical protein